MALSWVARLTERSVVLLRRAHVDDRDLAEPRGELLDRDLGHRPLTTSTSAAIEGRCSSSAEPRRDPRGQLDAEHVARADHPGDVRHVREQALPHLERVQLAGQVVVVAATERVVVVAEVVVEAIHEQARPRTLGEIGRQQRRSG